jgi:transcription elongation factor Elf1
MSNQACNEELEWTAGYLYTHYDCPHCGAEVCVEGDTRDEVIECDHCGESFQG